MIGCKLKNLLSNRVLLVSILFWARSLVVALTFILLVKILKVSDYGLLVALQSMLSIAAAFVGLGYPASVVSQSIIKGKSIPTILYQGLMSIAATAPLGALLVSVLFTGIVYDGLAVLLIAAYTVSELLQLSLIEMATQIFLVEKKEIKGAALRFILPFLRIPAVIVLYSTGETLGEWIQLLTVINLIVSVGLLSFLTWKYGLKATPTLKFGLRATLPFALANFFQRGRNDNDKILLPIFLGPEVAGAYAVAYRIVELIAIPIVAFSFSSYVSIFEHVKQKGGSAIGFFKGKNLKPLVAIACFSILALILAGYSLPLVLRASYILTSSFLFYFMFFPVLMMLEMIVKNSLDSLGLQSKRSFAQGVALLTGITLNLCLIPVFGAIGALLALHGSLITVITIGTFYIRRFERRSAPPIRKRS